MRSRYRWRKSTKRKWILMKTKGRKKDLRSELR